MIILNKSTTKKIAFLSLLITFALILSYVESLVPQIFPIPGIKLGLANFAIVITLYYFGFKEALLVNFCRILLAAALFGSVYSFIYALSGGILSILVEYILLKSKKMSEVGVSVAGGIAHNLGQLIFAYIVTRTFGLVYYLPFLMISGVLTGFLIGILVLKLKPVLKKIIKSEMDN